MVAPVARLKKSEIIELSNWTCKHGHNGLTHYPCWVRDGKPNTKTGYLDIEASHLDANIGVMLSYYIKTHGEEEYFGRAVKGKEIVKDLDKHIVKDCIDDMLRYDTIITYYGTGFDLPFIRTRALEYRYDFPFYGALKHIDCYYIAKSKLKMSSKRLAAVEEYLFGKGDKTRVEWRHWIKALQGYDKSIKYIDSHNKIDVEVLERVYNLLKVYTKGTKRSV